MNMLIMLCTIMPGYGCVPFDTLADCEAARDRVSAIVELVGCVEGEFAAGSQYAPQVAPAPEVKP